MLLKYVKIRTAQSVIEYVLLFAIVATAGTFTYKYLYRSMNARLKQVQEELSYKRSDSGNISLSTYNPGRRTSTPDTGSTIPGGPSRRETENLGIGNTNPENQYRRTSETLGTGSTAPNTAGRRR